MAFIFHVSELWWACSKFPCAWRVLFTLYVGAFFCSSFLAAWRTFSCQLTWDFSASDLKSTELPVSRYLADSFSFIAIHRIDSRSQTWWGSFLLVLAAHHQIHRSCRQVPITMRCLTLERKLLTWLQEYIEKLIMLNKHRRWFHSFFEKLPWVKMSASWFFGVNIFDLDLEFQIDSVE